MGNSKNIITVYPYYQIVNNINSSNENLLNDDSARPTFKSSEERIPTTKLILDYHTSSVNGMTFTKKSRYFLISGGSDKNIIVWKIIPENFTYDKFRIIRSQSDILDLVMTPNDEYIFSGCIDNNIYVWRSNFQANTFELVNCINSINTNFITSICLDPSLEKLNYENPNCLSQTGIRFASYSDNGQLVLAETYPLQNGFKTNIIKDFKEFINVKNKFNSMQKKIDWSSDSNWIVSVNHHYIKEHKVVHSKLINLNDILNPYVLIGHDSAVLIAKFSPVNYVNKQKEVFSLLATSDKNGNLIIWTIVENVFKPLTEISNFSESCITFLLWSQDGNYLFAANSNGSIYIVEFNEFSQTSNAVINPRMDSVGTKKRITPILLNSNSQNVNVTPNISMNLNRIPLINPINEFNNSFIPNFNPNPNQSIQDCLKCQKMKVDSLESKIVNLKLDSFADLKAYISWENKIYDNYCNVQLRIKEKILFNNKFENRLIRLFKSNNYLFAFYDTQNNLNIFTILNTMILYNLYVEDITFIDLFTNYLLYITSNNKITLIDVNKKEKVFESILDLNSSPSSPITTKISSVKFLDLERIIIYIDTYNVFKNRNTKNMLVYNRTYDTLTQFVNSEEIESIIVNSLQEQIKTESHINYFLKDQKFFSLMEEKNLLEDNEQNLFLSLKLNDEIRSIEEKLNFYQLFSQQNEFIMFLKKYLNLLTKNNLFYRLIDFFAFYFKFNEKKIFKFLDDKVDQIVSDLIDESICRSQLIPGDIKEFIIKLINL